MAQKGRVDLNTASETTFPSNLNKEITAANHRVYNDDISDSKFNLIDDTLASINLSNTLLGDNAESALENIYKTSIGQYVFYLDVTAESAGVATDLVSFSSNNPTLTVTEQSGRIGELIVNYTDDYGFNQLSISDGDLINFSSSDSGVYTVRYNFINISINYIADL